MAKLFKTCCSFTDNYSTEKKLFILQEHKCDKTRIYVVERQEERKRERKMLAKTSKPQHVHEWMHRITESKCPLLMVMDLPLPYSHVYTHS